MKLPQATHCSKFLKNKEYKDSVFQLHKLPIYNAKVLFGHVLFIFTQFTQIW